ncbi:MAG: beta-lactamase [Symbiobacteriaceae bacterium]|jgi:beta-lactamase class A|nr:beta-lactamase [Symbiobacteriaceae bacterium]
MNLEQKIEGLAATFSGTLGVAAKNLSTGETFAYQERLSFHPASTIKLPVLAAAYEAVDAGTLTLEETLPLDPDLCRPDGGIMDGFTPGYPYPVRDLAHLMITISDNTATNMLIKRVGFDAVNRLLDRWGMTGTRLNRYIGIGAVPAGRQSSHTTPADMARFLELLALGAEQAPGLSAASCQAMLATMQKQVFHHLTTRFIDEFDEELDAPTVRVASKSGWFRTVRNDCAVVYAPRATYVLAMFSRDCKDESYKLENEAALLLPKVSRIIYEEWGR